MKRQRLEQIDLFRAVAIMMIVMNHCFHLASYQESQFGHSFIKNFMANWSACFIFISGFFTFYIEGKIHNFSLFKNFLTKKLKKVFLPYLFCSMLIIFFKLDPSFHLPIKWWHDYTPTFNGMENWILHFNLSFIPVNQMTLFIWQLLLGLHAVPYWFIPAIFILFLFTPFLHFILQSKKLAPITLLTMMIVSNFTQRPTIWSSNPIQCAVYYLFFFSLGIYVSIHYQKIKTIFYKYFKLFFMISMIFLVAQTFYSPVVGSFNKDFFEYRYFDYSFWQKLFLIFFFLGLPTNSVKNINHPFLKKIAYYSFSIFFLHEIVIFLLSYLKNSFSFQTGSIFTLTVTTLIVLLLTLALSTTIKKIFKKKTVYLIGLQT